MSNLSAHELVFLCAAISRVTMRIFFFKSLSIDLVKDALGQLAVISASIPSYSNSSFFFCLDIRTYEPFILHYALYRPETKQLLMKRFYIFTNLWLLYVLGLTTRETPQKAEKFLEHGTVHRDLDALHSMLCHLGKTQADINGQRGEQYEAQDGGPIFVVVKSFGTACAKAERTVHEDDG